MRLGVELYDVREGESGGLVPLLQGVLESLFADWPEHRVTLFGTTANRNLFPSVPAHVEVLTLPRDGYFPLLDVYASYCQLDVLLRSYPGNSELVFPMSRQIVVIPDLQHEYFPDFFDAETLKVRRWNFNQVLQQAGAIATISAHARDTLVNHAATRCQDIFLMSPALTTERESLSLEDLTKAERALLPNGDFFLYPANLWPHKNHRRVLEGFQQFLQRTGQRVELVCTGHPEGWESLVKDFPGLPVRHLGYVRRGFLQLLLARSRALMFFSLFEGFGMPLLEAFAAGTPVACSNTTSLPEVGGDAVLSCDPTDTTAICALMIRLYQDPGVCARLVARGKERLAHYNWHASAAQLVAACQRLQERGSGTAETGYLPLHHLNHFLVSLQEDRAERLALIQRLVTTLSKSQIDNDVLREHIAKLTIDLDVARSIPHLDTASTSQLLRRLPDGLRRTMKRLLRTG